MRIHSSLALVLIFLFSIVIFAGCSGIGNSSQWERKCASCHDGVTKLNDRTVADKELLRSRYSSLEEFTNACEGSPSCMNILKHNKELFNSVGQEIGVGKASSK